MGIRVAIDSGHGSNTGGKRTAPFKDNIDINGDGKIDVKKNEQYREHFANVGVSYFLYNELDRCGFDLIKTAWNDSDGSDDEDVSLGNRQKSIRNNKCDYSISVHFNAIGDGKSFNNANGIGIYIHDKYPADSKAMASKILEQLLKGTIQTNRGITPSGLALCNCNSMGTKGSILLELAFMTNELEAQQMMANEDYWKECAIEIAKGFCEYTGVKYVQEINMPIKAISKESSKEDIMWLQDKLNSVLEGESFAPLKVDGIYGNKTRILVLIYFEKLGWNQDKVTGWKVGKGTISALNRGRTK